MAKNGNLPWICLQYSNTYIARMSAMHQRRMLETEIAAIKTERRDTALLATAASKLRWSYGYSLCDSLTRADAASPVLDETVSMLPQGCMEDLFFSLTITTLKQSVIMSQSYVQWRYPLRMECTTRLVCPCLSYSFNLIYDKFGTFALALLLCLLHVWHKFYTSAQSDSFSYSRSFSLCPCHCACTSAKAPLSNSPLPILHPPLASPLFLFKL